MFQSLAYCLAWHIHILSLIVAALFNAGIMAIFVYSFYCDIYVDMRKLTPFVLTVEAILCAVAVATFKLKRYLAKRWPKSVLSYW